MNGSTPPINDRKIVSSGYERPFAQITPTVVVSSANISGTPASAMTKKTANSVSANIRPTRSVARACGRAEFARTLAVAGTQAERDRMGRSEKSGIEQALRLAIPGLEAEVLVHDERNTRAFPAFDQRD